ncbi:MAG: membrane-bound lytic murein transglycosylase MltF [Zoogloeaceae bacterium]|jgi:membrane-bound lytic murein transglycosylase F|nr:membrane-bound lytic murein transglycosylase MltF [Zoogloeaceae bacterium]
MVARQLPRPQRVLRIWLLVLAAPVAALALGLWLWRQNVPLPYPKDGKPLIVLTHPGILSYQAEGRYGGTSAGLEHDLAADFARQLGVPVQFLEVPRAEIPERLARHEAHMAAGWLSASEGFTASASFYETRDVLARVDAALPISNLENLRGKTVWANAGTRAWFALEHLRQTLPGLRIEAFHGKLPMDILEALSNRKIEIALVDEALLDIGLNLYPNLDKSLQVGPKHPIHWLFPQDGDPKLVAAASAFILESSGNGLIARLIDRYLGHLERLSQIDTIVFIERIGSLLPRYRPLFERAQLETGIDWRLLAALAYQESQWNPLNTSYTGVRGIMMLTEDTADFLGVDNRLDPAQSIPAGARYLNYLRDQVPATTPEPDRTWQALAAYNIGPGHFSAARKLAARLGVDGDAWPEMKKILPLLARPAYYSRLKSGKARGGEAVILVENIRVFYDILTRYEKPYRPKAFNETAKPAADKTT